MQVKVKFKDIIHKTSKATLFLMKYEKEVWIPNKLFYFGNGRNIIISKDIAISKNLEFKLFLHIPKLIKPVFNQQPIEDLKI
jgi:hypothetical protein